MVRAAPQLGGPGFGAQRMRALRRTVSTNINPEGLGSLVSLLIF